MSHIEAGQPAPDFSLNSIDGRQVSLQKLLAKGPVALAFFKVSCPVCQFTMPFLQRIVERSAGNAASMIGISQDDARSTTDFNHEYGVQFPVLLDDAGYPVSNAYGLTSVPTLFLIAPDGTIKLSGAGFSKTDLQTIAAEFAEDRKTAPAPLFRPEEVIPAYKPG